MNEETFFSALRDAPGDEVTWLALADWLEEDGQPQRAELVRLVRRLRALPAMDPNPERIELEGRVAALLLAGVRPAVPEVMHAIGMRFAILPAGSFRMGSPEDEKGHQRREGPCRVTLTRPFYLGVFPVTQRQYEAVMGDNPSCYRPGGREGARVAKMDTADHPVENVSWLNAVEFCQRLTRMEAKRSRTTYRLPSEAEWEYACRAAGAVSTPFHLGASPGPDHANFGSPNETAKSRPVLPCAVGLYPPNAWGLYDMHGQVWEWCADWLGEDTLNARSLTDPTGPHAGTYRVLRGGTFRSAAHECRAAYRGGGEPSSRYDHVGFRVAADLPRAAPRRRRRK